MTPGRGGSGRPGRRWLVQTVVGLLALPLSVVPFWLYSTKTDSGYLMYLKARYSLSPPVTGELDAATRRVARVHRRLRPRGVPVLVYHGIGRTPADTGERRFIVPRRRFADQMLGLREAGYRPITTAALARYLRDGERRHLPEKPVLITFDDGRVDAMLQGDPILRDSGMRATMFVIGRPSDSASPYYEDWGELEDHARSGRWELANHTYDLHHRRGKGPAAVSALVHRRPDESLRSYVRRVEADLAKADGMLAEHRGEGRDAFAYPFGDWGETAPRATRAALDALLRRRFDIAFDQDMQEDWRPTRQGDDPLHVHRLSVEGWTGAQLLRRLERAHGAGSRPRR